MTDITGLRKEFLADPDLCGSHGYCNERFGGMIADWWIERMRQALEAQRKAIRDEVMGMKFVIEYGHDEPLAYVQKKYVLELPSLYPDNCPGSIAHYGSEDLEINKRQHVK